MSENAALDNGYDTGNVVQPSNPARSGQSLLAPADAPSVPRTDIDLVKPPPKKPLWKEILGYVLAQWLILGLGVLILLAWAFPSIGKNGGAIRAEITVKYAGVGG
jgi:hypothetical protein